VLITNVLVNVIDNACKYSPEDSLITITVQQVDSSVCIQVADNGRGIPPEDVDRVFEKFYRAPNSSNIGGAGLGLSICRGLVEAHHGKIWAAASQEGGTTINILLPGITSSEMQNL